MATRMSDIWYMLGDAERYVYHYTKAETLIEHILATRTLRFSTFDQLNDPREYKKFDLDAHAAGALRSDFAAVLAELEQALKRGWKIACFTADPDDAVISPRTDALGPRQLDAMYERGHSRPRMWAQYGDGHHGACLVFRKRELDQAIRTHAKHRGLEVFCGPVAYRNVPVVGHLGPGPFSISMDSALHYGVRQTVDRHIREHLAALYLTKNVDWAAEREFRWLLRGPEEAAFIDFGHSLVGIAIGELFPEDQKPALGRHALKNRIELAVMDWRRGIPQPKPLTSRMLLPEGDPARPKTGW